MKFTVQPSDLKTAFQAVKGVVQSKPAMPVLENILLRPDGDSAVTLTATDQETTITARMVVDEAVGLAPFLIPAQRLSDFIGNAMGEWPVMLDTDGDEIILGDGFGDFRFFGNSVVKDFPVTPDIKEEEGMTIPMDASRLVESASAAVRFTGNDSLRPIMSGVCLDFRTDGLRVCASDSKILYRDILRDVASERNAVVVVNRKVIEAMTAHCSLSEPVEVSFDTRSVRIRQSEIQIVGRLVDGRFPNFDAVIPKNNNREVVLNRSVLSAAVKRVSISANKSTNQIRLRFNGGSRLTLEASDIDFSLQSKFSVDTVSQKNLEGEHLTAVRASLFLSILSTFAKDVTEIVMLMGEPNRAMLVKSSADSERVCLIMPMQVVD